jgi:hypothetical protein
MELECSLPCSQEPAIGPYSEPHESSPYHFSLFLWDPFKFFPPTYFSSLQTKPCMIPLLPHAFYIPWQSYPSLLEHSNVFGEEHKLWSASLCNFLQPHFISSPYTHPVRKSMSFLTLQHALHMRVVGQTIILKWLDVSRTFLLGLLFYTFSDLLKSKCLCCESHAFVCTDHPAFVVVSLLVSSLRVEVVELLICIRRWCVGRRGDRVSRVPAALLNNSPRWLLHLQLTKPPSAFSIFLIGHSPSLHSCIWILETKKIY